MKNTLLAAATIAGGLIIAATSVSAMGPSFRHPIRGAASAQPAGLTASAAVGKPAFAASDVDDHRLIHATFTIKNTTNAPVRYARGGLGVEWLIVDKSGKTVYDSTYGKRIPQFMMLRMLAGGGHDDLAQDIPLQNQDGSPLPAGHYTLQGRLFGGGGLTASTPLDVK